MVPTKVSPTLMWIFLQIYLQNADPTADTDLRIGHFLGWAGRPVWEVCCWKSLKFSALIKWKIKQAFVGSLLPKCIK